MKLKPGCGCLLLILAAGNLVLVIASILAAARGTLGPLGGVGMGLMFAANAFSIGMLGFAALRGVQFGRGGTSQDTDEPTAEELPSDVVSVEDEGED